VVAGVNAQKRARFDATLVFAVTICLGGFDVASAFGATIVAKSVEFGDVQDAVTSASYGDTVLVPSGTVNWSTEITITKGISLVGAGIDKTVIQSSAEYMILYAPDKFSRDSNLKFEVTGFTFDGMSSSGATKAIGIYNDSSTVVSKILIHQNRFYRAHYALYVNGNVYGVFYENKVDYCSALSYNLGNNRESWEYHSSELGTAENMYYEDNVISGGAWIGAGHGGRYVLRYNTWSDHNIVGMFDMHGNQPGGLYATMQVEVYGNEFVNQKRGESAIDQRGGRTLFFYNLFTGPASNIYGKVREEYCDSISPCAGCIQHVNSSYYWNNRKESSIISPEIVQNSCSQEYSIEENVDIFNYSASFDGSLGVGCGPLASRPDSCVIGVGYWATNQNCASVNRDNVGDSPREPINGTLYVCDSAGLWTPWYQPFTYPHPLRAFGVSISSLTPSAPVGLRILE